MVSINNFKLQVKPNLQTITVKIYLNKFSEFLDAKTVVLLSEIEQ